MKTHSTSAQVAINRLIESRDRLTDAETIIATWMDNSAKRSILLDLSAAFDSVDALIANIKNGQTV